MAHTRGRCLPSLSVRSDWRVGHVEGLKLSILFVLPVAIVVYILEGEMQKKHTRSYIGIKRPTFDTTQLVQKRRGNAPREWFQSMPSKILLGLV